MKKKNEISADYMTGWLYRKSNEIQRKILICVKKWFVIVFRSANCNCKQIAKGWSG